MDLHFQTSSRNYESASFRVSSYVSFRQKVQFLWAERRGSGNSSLYNYVSKLSWDRADLYTYQHGDFGLGHSNPAKRIVEIR